MIAYAFITIPSIRKILNLIMKEKYKYMYEYFKEKYKYMYVNFKEK